jgi:hypothetical protein
MSIANIFDNLAPQMPVVLTTGLPIGWAQWYLNTSISLSNVTVSNLKYDTNSQPNSNISYNVSTGVFTINTDGFYWITANTIYQTNGSNNRWSWFQYNNPSPSLSVQRLSELSTGGLSNADSALTITYFQYFNQNDTLNTVVYQTSGSTISLYGKQTNGAEFNTITFMFINPA